VVGKYFLSSSLEQKFCYGLELKIQQKLVGDQTKSVPKAKINSLQNGY
jgi:hypothetical protein